ncbi:hypothetical protein [Meiothermus taiwanensis]|uniref:hypothetical protein n=1 Tax=Meiothermus taiwanensis TaxID=172827 RepID=UPI0004859BA6|nr:hypothetical protein [Meiothermus taiwanensis]KZK16515.1 hypothetical protein A3962_14730 [Meiothermus taiwanensis]
MATICLYETPGTGKNWFGAGGIYDVICEYALAHPSVQALPEFAKAIEDSLWYRGLELYEHDQAAIKAFTEAVGDLLRYIASPEGKARWGEYHPVILEAVQILYDLLLDYDPERYK